MCRTTTTISPTKSNKTFNVVKKSRPTTKARKRVSFSGTNKVTFRHLMKEELDQAWYKPVEYQGFQFDRLYTIQTLRQAKGDLTALDAKNQCVRGLEMQATPEIYRFRSNGIKTTIQQVLNAQQIQKLNGCNDDTSLGLVSMLLSQQACKLATSLAAIDASASS